MTYPIEPTRGWTKPSAQGIAIELARDGFEARVLFNGEYGYEAVVYPPNSHIFEAIRPTTRFSNQLLAQLWAEGEIKKAQHQQALVATNPNFGRF